MLSVYLAVTLQVRGLDLHLLQLEGPMTQRHAAAMDIVFVSFNARKSEL